jgi:hypothetical protein
MMTVDLALLLGFSAVGGLATVLIVLPGDDSPDRPSRWRPSSGRSLKLAVGVITGALVLALSGWLVPAVVCGIASGSAAGAIRRRSGRPDDIARIDALASWIENLRDVLLAGDQPVGAIRATVESCPPSIRPAVRRVAAALGHQDPEVAFRRFADDLDDPLGDLIAAGLLIAVQRGARTVAVLSSLAEQARAQADRRRLIDAERAPLQREVTILTAVMGGLIVGLLVFGRAEYLEPYSTFEGQLVLAIVLSIYGVLLIRVQRLARFPAPRRFFGGAPRLDRERAAEVAR